ncbi:hypothetical protein PAAG_02729 [Paracoccidioides lutzii Pb01]|uniref:Uncharacterized protein n=1 Tax=Paracoccidioides lutzii (strain ATCC MYA-826 / Pb01) TaxID=502779 RepID=C1GW34_PARBA|nr:hypothetical protein PAAG_02729 [Paracoccidioides lutzii Pb01]EEH40753.2 hypothetical protein PAAG_02729 [Paracoccidioides lutzii Pb01]
MKMYNALSQSDDHDDDEVASDASASDRSESPLPPSNNLPFQKISLDVHNLGGGAFMSPANMGDEASPTSLSSVIKSLAATSASYDMLEEDDYTAAADLENSPAHIDSLPSSSQSHLKSNNNTNGISSNRSSKNTASPVSPDEPIIQSSVSGRPVPLRHPTPDLQSLQGAYVGNVERLERSAETLSSTSDIRGELRKLNLEQKRRSVSSPGCSAVNPRGPASPVRNYSTPSLSNSIISVNNTARSNGYSPEAYVTSPRGSIMSGSSSQSIAGSASRVRSASGASRLAQVPEPVIEDQPAQFQQIPAKAPLLPPPDIPQRSFFDEQHPQLPLSDPNSTAYDDIPEECPDSADSTDTYKESMALFKDFDGVHFTPHPRERPPHQRVSSTKLPLTKESHPLNVPPPGQKMVYYPAPVPMVLNLPQRLSKKPNPQYEKHRSQIINSLSADARKVAAWLPPPDDNDKEVKGDARQAKRLSELPPQLRASAFFEQPPAQLDIQIKQNSAVATLDSILDAAAKAPVSAFTDHPIVGHVGAEVYGKPSGKRRLKKVSKPKAEKKGKHVSRKSLSARDSVVALQNEGGLGQQERSIETEGHAAEGSDEVTPFRESYDGDAAGREQLASNLHNDADRRDDEDDDEWNEGRNEEDECLREGEKEGEDEDEDSDDETDLEETYVGAPTTLLAELQMRKQEQKQRRRTAATAFPNGMHSTLLELDAVAQHQRMTRNQRHITLAWEDPGIAERNKPEDENVPLAVLYPKNLLNDENRPMGLMEKLELEENEPLSRRRARIRGEPLCGGGGRNGFRDSEILEGDGNGPGNAGPDGDDEGEEGETLAQLARRLKAEEIDAKLTRDFTDELLSQFGVKSTDGAEGEQGKEGEEQSSSRGEEKEKKKEKETETETVEPAEETLGQRRQRLQAEKEKTLANGGAVAENTLSAPLKQRHSLASVLQAHPSGNAGSNPYLSGGDGRGTWNANRGGLRNPYQQQVQAQAQAHPQLANHMAMNLMQQQYHQQGYGYGAAGNGTKYAMNPSSHVNAGTSGYRQSGQFVQGQYPHAGSMNNLGMYGNGYGDAHIAGVQRSAIIDPGQAALIDRWRQSVRN